MTDEVSPFGELEVDIDRLIEDDRCVVRDGCIVLPGTKPIPLDRCDTAEKILAWVYHLAGQPPHWPVMERFVRTAADEHSIKINELSW